MPDLKLDLAHNQPYDWPALLRFFSARAIPGVDEVDGSIYRRTFAIGRARGRLSISPTKGGLVAEITTTGQVDEAKLTKRLRRLFDLDAPGRRIIAHLKVDEALGASLKKRPGLRVPGVWDPFELGVRAILGQQVSVAGASTLAGRSSALVSLDGRP